MTTDRPLLSVVIPTRGRPGLVQTLASIAGQTPPGAVEILVVGDTHAGTWATDLVPVADYCVDYGARYLEHDGGAHCWGHPQRNHGQAQARGAWIGYLQDDAVWLPDAWATLRRALRTREAPHLFRVQSRHALVWQVPHVAEGNVDADGIVVPNVPAKLGQWGWRYSGDFDFIAQTVALWQGRVRWCQAQIAEHVGP